ncbi:MAG: LamG-like jellyroll fold domain-containing protein, partial [Bythopirellula sp.]
LSGVFNYRMDDDAGNDVISNTTGAPFDAITQADDVWTHVAVNVLRSTNVAELFFNGASQGTYDISALTGNIAATQDMQIGVINGGAALGAAQASGLDDLAFYSGTLTSQEITDLANATITPADFLPKPLSLEVNTTTGAVTMQYLGDATVDIDYYEISSPTDALNANNWSSLEDQNIAGFPTGSGDGDGWEEAGGSSDSAVGETFLDGSSTFGTATNPIDLGLLFRTNGDQDLDFVYRDAATGGFKEGLIEYVVSNDLLFGDADNDLAVAGSDLLAVTNNFGNTGPDDGLLLGDADDDGAVAGSDLLAVTNNFGNTLGSGSLTASAVPEPSTVGLLALAATALVAVRSRRQQRLPMHVLALLIGAMSLALVSTASAGSTVDRLYQFGDDSSENGNIGQTIDANPNTGGFTFDSEGPTGAFIDIEGHGGVTYVAGRSGGVAASFDGTDNYLDGLRLGFPETSASSTAATLSADVPAAGPLDYVGIANRGFQLWANPATVGGSAQTLVRDTDQHGLAIGDNGNWVLRYATQSVDSGVSATAGVWTHAMVVRPTANSGARLYIDGVAVAAAGGSYTLSDNSDLVVGATLGAGSVPTEFFNGTLDELEMFIAGTSTDTRTRYGVFNPGTDNESIASQLTSTFGDITLNGTFDGGDVTAFVDGWLSENEVNGILVGDINSYQDGDLDFNGIVDIGDAIAFNSAMNDAGMGSLFAQLGGASVPEPASMSLLVLFGGGLVVLRLVR